MATYTEHQQRKKEEIERLRREEISSSLLILDLKEDERGIKIVSTYKTTWYYLPE